MIILETDRLILRDLLESDIENRLKWETIDREWQQWDGPWEYEGMSKEQEEAVLTDYIAALHRNAEKLAERRDDGIRFSLQIEVKETGAYIGWVSCYCIDDDYSYTDGDGKYAIGIDIPSQESRGKGYGREALAAYRDYLLSKGVPEIYTQTWSGNVRMCALAEKLGFQEVNRKKEYRTVAGKKYDGLTFRYQ